MLVSSRLNLYPFTIAFLFIALGAPYLPASFKIDYQVFRWVNLAVFVATVFSYFFYRKAVGNKSPHAFITMVYMGMFVKMLLLLFAAFIYIYTAGKNVNKPAILAGMGAYLIYTSIEMYLILRLNKQKENAEERSSS